jgi:hypothetical protein
MNNKRLKNRISQGRVKKDRKVLSHKEWSFKPRLENEAVVLHSILDIYTLEYYTQIVDDVRNLITELIRNHGFTDGAKRYGVIKNYTISLIEFRNPVNPGWLSTSEKHRIPSKLGINFVQLIADYMRNTDAELRPKYFQVVLTILNIVRMIEGLSEADFLSVTEKASAIDDDLLSSFETYVSNKLKPHKYNFDSSDLKGYRFRLHKNGPNGKPKIETAHEEAVCLLNSSLNRPFKSLCSEMKLNYLYEYLSLLTELVPESHEKYGTNPAQTKIRKLVSVPDSGFKTRIVAIVDFWTQLVLEPIRDHVLSVTKQMFVETDFRLNQDLGVSKMVDFQNRCLSEEVLKEHKLNIRSLKFYDISSWTDRFHRDLQKIVMKHLFSPRLAESWAQLVVHCPWYVGGLAHTIKYGQGQGMGTNGSFDIATLTDHLLIHYVLENDETLSGLFPNNACYGKVGDDLWIYDPNDSIKNIYEKINLPINFSKSKEYSEVGSVAEFCSRTFLDGGDVSRISPKIISKSKDIRYIPTLLSICASRGIELSSSSFTKLGNTTKDGKETYFDKLQPWIISLLAIGTKERSLANSLTLEYLRKGKWISEKSEKIISDPALLDKILISYNIVRIAESIRTVKDKAAETFNLSFSVPWGDMDQIVDSNLFMNDQGALEAKGFFKVDRLLLPKEIILIQRLADQHRLVSNIPNGMLELEEDRINPIKQLSDTLHSIAVRSVYDQGNISYDVKQVYSTSFKIVKTIESSNEDFTVLRVEDQETKILMKNTLLNNLDGQGWGKELPELVVP